MVDRGAQGGKQILIVVAQVFVADERFAKTPKHFDAGGDVLQLGEIPMRLPDTSDIGGPAFFSLTIALPGVFTTGGFNNVGWSVGVSNFNSDGNLGFQCSSAFGQTAGYYTNNASFYNGSSWSLFSFGSGAYGVANFVADITVPAPHTFTIGLAGAALLARRRR